jgi:Holliday junction resolvase
MSNKQYVKGRRKEYKVVNQAKAKGQLAFRSAGSHSPVDVVIIDSHSKVIHLVQCKPDSMTNTAKDKIYQENMDLEGTYLVYFDII